MVQQENSSSSQVSNVTSDSETPLIKEESDNLCNNSFEIARDPCESSSKYPIMVTVVSGNNSVKPPISFPDEKKPLNDDNGNEHEEERLAWLKSFLQNLNRYNNILPLVALVVCVVSTALTVSVWVTCSFGIAIPEPMETADSKFAHPVCVQCIKLVQDPFNHMAADPLIDKLVKRLDDGFQMCCAENEEQMSALVEAMMREQVTRPIPRSEISNPNLQFVPVSAHKQLLSADDRELNLTEPYYGNSGEHFVVKLNSEYDDPLTEHAHGVTVLDTALQIQYSGVYYVYFSVNTEPRSSIPGGNSRRVHDWSQYVHHTRPNSPAHSGVLLQVSRTPCSNCSRLQESTFAGGTFTLQKNDLIQVCLAGLGLVQYRKESSYLGVVLLSNSPTEN